MGEALDGGLAQAAPGLLLDVVGDRPQEQVAARPLGCEMLMGPLPSDPKLRRACALEFDQLPGEGLEHAGHRVPAIR